MRDAIVFQIKPTADWLTPTLHPTPEIQKQKSPVQMNEQGFFKMAPQSISVQYRFGGGYLWVQAVGEAAQAAQVGFKFTIKAEG